MSIPRGLIRKLSGDNSVYTEGLSLLHTDFPFQITPTAYSDFYSVTADFPDENCRVILEIDNGHEWIEAYHCTCETGVSEGTVCKHIIALLLKIENEFFSDVYQRESLFSQDGLSTDSHCLALLEERTEVLKKRARQRASFEKAIIYPVASIKDGMVHISVKAGCGRGYIIKDLSWFYNALSNKITAPCGRSEKFIYIPENFLNEAFTRFFMAYYPMCKIDGNSKEMRLTPDALERFLAIFNGEKLTSDEGFLHLTDDIPEFILNIKPGKDFYRLSLSCIDFDILTGLNEIYIKQNDILYCCGSAFSDSCGSLLRCFLNTKQDVIIQKDDMPTFYSLIIKPATKFIQMDSVDKSFIPGPLKARIYLDVEGKTVTARTEFHYDHDVYFAFSTDRDLLTAWDIEEETLIENLIKKYFHELGKDAGTAYFVADDEKLFNLVYEGIPALSQHAVLYIGAELKNIRIKSFPSASVAIRAESDLLTIDIHAGELSMSTLSAALSAYKQKKKYIRLHNGSYLYLETEAMSQFLRLANGMGISSSDLKKQEIQLPAYRALYLDSIREIKIKKDKSFIKLVNDFTNIEQDIYPLSSCLEGVLRDYQLYGHRWLSSLTACGFGGILADDMGLGKTLQMLSLLQAQKDKNNSVKALVICPASLILNWDQEIKRFTPSLQSLCIMGSGMERSKLLRSQNHFDVIITSYDLLKRDIHHYQEMEFDFEIIDEAQYIKNHKTQNAKAVKAIRARHRFALTGTPVENSLAELWSIFDFLMPGYLFRYTRFRQRFEVPIIRDGDTLALSELKKMISPFILRRMKQEVLKELPEKTETILYTQLAEEQNKLYYANVASMHRELALQLDGNTGQNQLIVLAMLMRLRQLCCDPALVYENYKEKSAKFDLCMNLVESSVASGHKLLIFSQFTGILSAIGKQLRQMGLNYYLIEGSTKKEDRIAQVDAFNQDDTPVFLISLKAGGTGLNLTGADIVIHYDPWWNLSTQNQATDRAHRIGQKNKVSVYKLIAKDTVEEKILALAERKQKLANDILPDENSLLSKLSKEEILKLFD